MPNVMGREFPYTPQGMAAAEQYKQAMGMRDGGMMGFRPIGYANGSPGVPITDLMAVVRELTNLEQTGTTEQVKAYVLANKDGLLKAAEQNPEFADYLQRMITRFAPQQTPDAVRPDMLNDPTTRMPQEMTSPTDNTGEYLLLNPDMAPRQEMGPPGAGQPFRGGGLASLRHY